MDQQQKKESFTIDGANLIGKFKELIRQSSIRRIIISDKDGKTIAEFPLTVGLVGAVISPMLAAVGAIAALATECTITVIRDEDSK